jgi:hypothetical protein
MNTTAIPARDSEAIASCAPVGGGGALDATAVGRLRDGPLAPLTS